jgi:hypothetical protein
VVTDIVKRPAPSFLFIYSVSNSKYHTPKLGIIQQKLPEAFV